MLTAIFCLALLLCSEGAEVQLTVTPEIVEPGITPFFTLRCDVDLGYEGNIEAIALYRSSITAKPGNTTPQLVAEILGTSPTTPSLVPGFEGLTVQGQIPSPEEDLEPYLEVVWPNPTLSDLGLYTCEVSILFETGGATALVEGRVTSSNALSDKLLVTVQALEEQFDALNQTVREIKEEISNITQALDTEIRPAVESLRDVRPVESPTGADVTPLREGQTPTEDIETAGAPSQPTDVELNRITKGLEELKRGLENIIDTLRHISVVISSLAERAGAVWETTTVQVDAEWETTTVQDPFRPEDFRLFFERDNSTYYLFRERNIDTRIAQTVCASGNHYLAEINDVIEFQFIWNQLSPFLESDQLVLVGGERQSVHDDDFIYPNSQQLVELFVSDLRYTLDFPKGNCLALLLTPNGLTFTSTACSSNHDYYYYFLCEGKREQS